MTRNTTCTECGGKMQKGHIVVEDDALGTVLDASYWLEGQLERGSFGWLKTKGKQQFYISAYRCEHCGFMKFYAGPDHTTEDKE